MAEKSGGHTMRQNTGKYISIYFCIISTTLTKTEGGGEGCFILQENFASKFLEN